MKISQMVVALLIFSALGIGIGQFFVGTAVHYTDQNEALQEFSEEFDNTVFIDDQMQQIQEKLNQFDPLNPLSWGNFVSSMINIFNIIFGLPAQFHATVTFMAQELLLIPAWVVTFIEILVLVIVVFSAISAVNKYEV